MVMTKLQLGIEGFSMSELVYFFLYSLRVRGQHTKTTGRKGRTVGVAKKKG
jgi:hypothetical protein